jgi:hypothetical protein
LRLCLSKSLFGMTMFVTVRIYRARIGEQDAVIALHESREGSQHLTATGYLSGELLQDIRNPRAFVDIVHYESESAERVIAQDPEEAVWRSRLASLTESESWIMIDCQSVWQAN